MVPSNRCVLNNQRENSLKLRLIVLGLIEYILEMNLDRTQGLKHVLYMNEERIYCGKKKKKKASSTDINFHVRGP